jgi:predicted outer membrane repeat protein
MYTYADGSPTVFNCIFWGDSPDEIFGPTTVSYSDVQGGYAGTGNIHADPRFSGAGDLRLRSFSPCTDAADNTAVPEDITTDLDGNPRFVDDASVDDTGMGDPPIVDMGAYERQSDSVMSSYAVPGDFASIQEALDYCVSGEEIVVAPGTYFAAINFLGKAVTLRSSDGPEATIIDGNGAFHVVQCVSGEGPNTVLEGFTITGGNADGPFPDDGGGGMLNANGSSPTVVYCIFAGNSADFGGGMHNDVGSGPTVISCAFSGNLASIGEGGGVYNSDGSPTLTNCTFDGNSAVLGGGIFAYGGELTGCAIMGNTAFLGGGLYNYDGHLELAACLFSANEADLDGGGLYNTGGDPALTGCTFSNNHAVADGGGLYNVAADAVLIDTSFTGNTADEGGGVYNLAGDPTLINCVFDDNATYGAGGGLHNNDGSPTLTNCTFSGNSASLDGGAMYTYADGSPTVSNCIFWGDSPDEIFGPTTVSYSDVQGGWAGAGNIDANPMFFGVFGGNYHLLAGSPCIDAGDNTAVPVGIDTDLDGNPRFVDDPDSPDCWQAPGTCGDPPIVDMGAYEFEPGGQPGDLNGDGCVDVIDMAVIVLHLGEPASGASDPMDLDGDGWITVLDARILVTLCTNPGCAVCMRSEAAAAPAGLPKGGEGSQHAD